MTLVTLSMATALMTVGQQPNFGPAKIAVVNLPRVSELYKKTRDLEDQFEQKRVALNQERQALKDKIERTRRSLQEELKPGTPEFNARRKQLTMQEAEMQWFVEFEGQKIEAGLASALLGIYVDIQNVVYEIAQQQMIDVVLAADQLPQEAPQSPTQVRQQIALQKVVFWSPKVDLTDVVVARLNEKYAANGGKAGLAKPPIPTENEPRRDEPDR
ncbi:MAG: OmpH family outer membrane protein [Phycisphaerae bacterium]|jgi:Skp family chaperone for outer membrane proteins